jgi:hypothetical protein
MSGKRITSEQVKIYMSNRQQGRTQAQSSAKASVSERSRRRIDNEEVSGEALDAHAVHTRSALVARHAFPGRLQRPAITHLVP